MSDQPATFARKAAIRFDVPLPGQVLQARIGNTLQKLAADLAVGEMVGHIKGILITENQGSEIFSITSLREGTCYRGDLWGDIREAEFSLNIILYGIEPAKIKSVFEGMLSSSGNDCTVQVFPMQDPGQSMRMRTD